MINGSALHSREEQLREIRQDLPKELLPRAPENSPMANSKVIRGSTPSRSLSLHTLTRGSTHEGAYTHSEKGELR